MFRWRIWGITADGTRTLLTAGEAAQRPERLFVHAGGALIAAELGDTMSASWTATTAPQVVDLDDPRQVIGAGDPEAW